MKKPVCVFLSLLLMLCVFAGCDSSDHIADSDNQMETFGEQSQEETTVAPVTTQAAATATPDNPNPTVTMPSLNGTDTEDTETTEKPQSGKVTERDTNDAQTSSSPAGSQTSSSPQSTTSTKTTGTPQTTQAPASGTDTPDPSEEPAQEHSTSTMSGTYANTLEQILDQGTLPDGTTTSSGSSVQYAVADVDGDGSSELIIKVPGSKELICSYNGAGGVTVEGTVSPGATYYSGGAVTVGSGSTMGYSGSNLSPYTVYSYDSGSGTYSLTARVDGWDSSLSATEDGENSFPSAIDADGNGYIYIIEGGNGPEYVDDAQYNAWRSAVLGGTAVSVGFQTISQSAIDSMD